MDNEQPLASQTVRDAADPLLDRVRLTYEGSFPPEERREFRLVRELLRDDPRFTLTVFNRAGDYVGFLTTWRFDGFTYAEHFAIEPAVRGGGIGARVLRSFLEGLASPLVLEVELPTDDLSRRRIGFYERLGFRLDSHRYFQPPYHPGDAPLEMRLMSYGAMELDRRFDGVRETLHREVYGVNPDGHL